jgi:hypothetical protein
MGNWSCVVFVLKGDIVTVSNHMEASSPEHAMISVFSLFGGVWWGIAVDCLGEMWT